MAEKIVIFVTHGADVPEKATLPSVVGNSAPAMDAQVSMLLQLDGVTLATKGIREHIVFPFFDPLKKMVVSFIVFGGQFFIFIPYIEARKITPDLLIDKTQMVKAGRVVQEVLEAKTVLYY